jgi:tetratricopeptide (TPR) repeat protein
MLGSDTLQLVDPHEALAGIAMTRGRLKEAERLWRRQLALSRASGTMGRHLFGLVQLAYLELRLRNDTTRSVFLVDSALRVIRLDSLLPGDRRYDELARFFIAVGQLQRARNLLDAAAAIDSVTHTPATERSWTSGLLAHAEGRTAEASAGLRRAADAHYCTICALPDLGRAYESAGRTREAADAYERYVATPWLWRYEPDAVELGWAMGRLAELRLQLGDTNRARASYERLLDLWQEADPELRPALQSVRRRTRELGAS